MAQHGCVVVIGGTSGIGEQIAKHYAKQRREVVVTGRDAGRAQAIAGGIGGPTSGLGLDLAEPETVAEALADLGTVDRLILAATERDENTVRDFDVARARRLVTLKLVGYTEAIHTLAPRLSETASIVIFGGLAKDRPYPGSTTVSTVNGGVTAMVRTLAVELAPVRVNALHPAIIGDSPYWRDKPERVLDGFRSRTPLGQLISMADVVDAAVFLCENRAVTGINLRIDGGWLLT
ncbi:MAG: SDR family oxidoreductase [Actinomycetota bacterium]|nr:SDR family oxidoreductase [Actinomycetota bacterium]